tara:strand:- start:1120 stop:2286 length:1167 start_codon:yes stop_codon:yes gene_type:complete
MSDKLKILCVPANEGGCAYYRIIAPMKKLEELYGDRVELRWNKNPLGVDEKTGAWKENWDFEDMKWADIVFTQNLSNFGGNYTARIVGKAKEFGKFVHYDTDDLLTNIYEGHRLYDVYKEKGLEDITKFIYNNSDLVTVTQKKFAERVSVFCNPKNKLAVIKNSIDYNLPCWNMDKLPKPKKKFTRFGWVGGIHHEQDLRYFSGVPHYVNQRVGRENIRWDFFGHPPANTPPGDWQYDVWKKYKDIILRGFKGGKNWDIHYAQTPDRYGQMFTSMDVALAPLEMNDFNDSKSEIKVAECGRYKIPLVATNCGAYDEWIVDGETGFLIDPDKPITEWVRVLSICAKNPGLVKRMGENLHKLTEENFDMNKVVGQRLALYEECMNAKKQG